jgi:hypothetical protein
MTWRDSLSEGSAVTRQILPKFAEFAGHNLPPGQILPFDQPCRDIAEYP